MVGCSLEEIAKRDDKIIVAQAKKVIDQANKELNKEKTKWDAEQIKTVVLPEMNMLLKSHTDKKEFYVFLSDNKMLESTYLIIDSLDCLNKSSLGKTILCLQDRIDKAMN